MKSHHRWWGIYLACAGTLCVALAWITMAVLKLETAEFSARAEAEQQESIRLALWRMDSWMAPRLAAEASRPYFEYQSFYARQLVYTHPLGELAPGEGVTASPLMTLRSPYFRIHFQIAPDGAVSSPQVPTGDMRRLAEGGLLTSEQIESNLALLLKLSGVLAAALPGPTVRGGRKDEIAELSLSEPLKQNNMPEPPAATPAAEQQLKNTAEFDKRKGLFSKQAEPLARPEAKRTTTRAYDALAEADQPVSIAEERVSDDADRKPNRVGKEAHLEQAAAIDVGPMKPVWFDDGSENMELLFYREVTIDGKRYVQGVVCDWRRLRDDLLLEIDDLLAGATLSASYDVGGARSGTMLASIPAALAYASGGAHVPAFSAMRGVLAITWIVVIAAFIVVAVTLASSIAFGERRSRFASAVTHELRTPLTSFRMYTEMLADGMVTDRAKAQSYLNTLKTEAARLATLVENVLAYARLEDGRRPAIQRDMAVAELMAEIVDPLQRRAADASSTLELDWAGAASARVCTDVEAVRQILLNLVDNACKYGGAQGSIEVVATMADGCVRIGVRDHGDGVTSADEKTIFSPFHRGRHENSEKPGIGLGLALSRGLARDLGGDLTLESNGGTGAQFVLELPRARG